MSNRRTRVLIVDDSATMQQVLREILSRDPQLEVVGEAFDAHQARAAIKDLDPDVITLDVEMPNMNGLEFLERLMRLRPMPVIMVSSLTSRGAETTIRALTQHMPALFTKPFAARLDRLCAPRVIEAYHGAPIEPGSVYVAPGGKAHLTVRGKPGALRCHLVETDLVNGHRPSVDVLFNSVTQAVGGRSAGIILTGMGRDGATGLDGMRKAGALTFGQTEDTCVVYGMPKVAFEIGAVAKQVPLQNMAAELFSALKDTR